MIICLRYILDNVARMRAIYSQFTTSALSSFALGGSGGGAPHQSAYPPPNQPPGGDSLGGAIGSILGGVLGGGGHQQPGYQQPGYQPSGGYGGYGGQGGQGSGGSNFISDIGSAIGSSLFSSAFGGKKEVSESRRCISHPSDMCNLDKYKIIKSTMSAMTLCKLLPCRNLTMEIVSNHRLRVINHRRLRVTNHRRLQNQPRVQILRRLPADINLPRTKFRKDWDWTIKRFENMESRRSQVHAK